MGGQNLLELEINFYYNHVEVNDIWIACFGTKGLRIYNWQLEQCWQWERE
jgi:hypothetical protein